MIEKDFYETDKYLLYLFEPKDVETYRTILLNSVIDDWGNDILYRGTSDDLNRCCQKLINDNDFFFLLKKTPKLVILVRKVKRFSVQIVNDGVYFFVGSFYTKEEARQAREEYRKKYNIPKKRIRKECVRRKAKFYHYCKLWKKWRTYSSRKNGCKFKYTGEFDTEQEAIDFVANNHNIK